MGRKIFLIDTENVNTTWKWLLTSITKLDNIILFYTENSPGIPYSDLKDILNAQKTIEMISCFTGKNGLDFQLVSYLGFLIKTAPKTEYIIVSNDSGYEAVIKFWKESGIKVSRLTVPQITKKVQNQLEPENLQRVKTIFHESLNEIPEIDEQFLIEIFTNTSIKKLQLIYGQLVKKYGQEKGRTVYQSLKQQLPEIYKALAVQKVE